MQHIKKEQLYVIKRNGTHAPFLFDKITSRIQTLSQDLPEIDPADMTRHLAANVFAGISTSQLDELAAEQAVAKMSHHPDFGELASRIAISNMHKNTIQSFVENATQQFNYVNPESGQPAPQLCPNTYQIIHNNAELLEGVIDYQRDYNFDYFGYKTLERAYLLKRDGVVKERPQQMLMRVAIGIHGDNLDAVLETYNLMSQQYFTHASPTLFNAGTPNNQMSSCFLLTMQEDSIDGIYNTLAQCAKISKYAGGIGLSIHNIRAKGSYIGGTNGTSNGIIPMLRVYNETARYVDQGGGKRKGSFAIYLEPWHADIMEFLDLKKNTGSEERRARDLFYAMWIPDLFMQRVRDNANWTLFCSNEYPGLMDLHGDAFKERYEKYEADYLSNCESSGKPAKRVVSAQAVWNKIVESQMETGVPYMLYKDSINRKSNQQNLGTIRSSNLCVEIMEYTSPDEVAVCNLASINLAKFVNDDGTYDFDQLEAITRVVTRNLNQVIDVNMYPVEEARRSNMRHRPIGIGVQALADVFLKLRYPFDSNEAKALNKHIFETMYYAAVTESVEQAKLYGAYETFEGSPASKGLLQFDLWNGRANRPTGRYNWDQVSEDVMEHGLRNSLLLAPMPTASTSQMLGNNECFEPYTTNIFTRRTLAGEFIVVNKHLIHDLIERELWDEDMRNALISERGSVQNIIDIPDDLKTLYRTVWELSMKDIIDMAADRGQFICQSQSMNLYMQEPTLGKISSMHFYAWQQGCKTGMYYLHTQSKSEAIAFTVNRKKASAMVQAQERVAEVEDTECLGCGA